MKTKLFAILALIIGVSLAGCGKKDDEIKAAMKDLNSFTSELVAKVKVASDPATGLVDAQKYFDAQQTDLKKKLNAIKGVREAQISEETKKQMQADITKNVTDVATLQITYANLSVRDSRFKAGLEKLVNDYQKLITG